MPGMYCLHYEVRDTVCGIFREHVRCYLNSCLESRYLHGPGLRGERTPQRCTYLSESLDLHSTRQAVMYWMGQRWLKRMQRTYFV